MKVKIELFQSDAQKALLCPATQNGAFPDFSLARLSLYEKTCPFCGQLLDNAECSCKKYNQAKVTLLASFKADHSLWLRQCANMLPHTVLKAQEISIKPTTAPENALLLFDAGTEAELNSATRPERWYISQGELTPTLLFFYIRKRGDAQYYSCKIKNIPPNTLCLLKNASKIKIGYTTKQTVINPNAPKGTLGNYHFEPHEHIVAEYSYNDYLLKLTEL